jgi:UDP-glucuronate 4-epimerase
LTGAKASKALVTGAAGFIGYYVCKALLDKGVAILGIDNLNSYYLPALKRDRLAMLEGRSGFEFVELDIADHERLLSLPGAGDVDVIIHLAAQAGVRHSIEAPFDYASSNLTGHLSILELARRAKRAPLLVYASSSSVYGANTKTPFSESDPVDRPVSLYAATKRADELMSEAYARLYGLPQIGLRFFTVYGPWGRPDMAYWTFTRDILAGKPICVFNEGALKRDFTYIDDIIEGVVACALQPPHFTGDAPHRIYNIGNNRPVELARFIELIENAVGKKAMKEMKPMQPGDVYETCADIDAIAADYGFAPSTPLEEGIPRFVHWYKEYRAKAGAARRV